MRKRISTLLFVEQHVVSRSMYRMQHLSTPMNLMQATCKCISFEMGRVTSLGSPWPQTCSTTSPSPTCSLRNRFPRADSHDRPLGLFEFHRKLGGKGNDRP